MSGFVMADRVDLLDRVIGDSAFSGVFSFRSPQRVGWDGWLGLLTEFSDREGHGRVAQNHLEAGQRLGVWVSNCRAQYHEGILPIERISILESVAGWTWNQRDAWWDDAMDGLRAFQLREGHCRVRMDHVESGLNLGEWAGRCRSQRQAGKLSAERIADVESVPGWRWNQLDAKWDESMDRLRAFQLREGHCNVPAGHIEENRDLGSELRGWRSAYSNDELLPEQIADLESVPGWKWSRSTTKWITAMEKLRVFESREGHCNVPAGHIEGDRNLGEWVHDCRSRLSKGSLSPDQIADLESVPGWSWSASQSQWDQAIRKLSDYQAREGHCGVPVAHDEGGFQLGRWVEKCRVDRKAGRLSGERISQLGSISGWSWSASQSQWDQAIRKLSDFQAREGHCRVPSAHSEGAYRLGQWVSVCRTQYRSGRLAPERVAHLESVPGWAWSAR